VWVAFLKTEPQARFLVVGKGPSDADIRSVFAAEALGERLHLAGILQPPRLADAYHAMDVFAFASKSETQGMVLTEAMAAGVPVVALDAPGVRDVVQDRHNGRLLDRETIAGFVKALEWVAGRSPMQRRALRAHTLATAQAFSLARTADRALSHYQALRSRTPGAKAEADAEWGRALNLIKAQWEITKDLAEAAGVALEVSEPPELGGPNP
jgi:glycosyltransferase involved in cell wall biosynthesis